MKVMTARRPSLASHLKGKHSGGGGGGSPYVAKAVNFDGATNFGTASLTAANNSPLVSISVWFKATDDPDASRNIFYCDGRQPGGNYTNGLWVQNAPTEGPAAIDLYLADVNSNLFMGHSQYDFERSVWHHFLFSGDSNHPTGEKIFRVYLDDIDVTDLVVDQGNEAAFSMQWNGKSFDVGSAGDESGWFVGDLADLRVMPGVALHDGGGDIPLATRRLFIDGNGKPVDPATATAALGAAGAVLCSGDATGFSTNQGSGGAFSFTAGALTNATTSPSD